MVRFAVLGAVGRSKKTITAKAAWTYLVLEDDDHDCTDAAARCRGDHRRLAISL